MKRINETKIVRCMILIGALFISLFYGKTKTVSAAENRSFSPCTVEIVSSMEDAAYAQAGYTLHDFHVDRNDREWKKEYFTFTIGSDSWVYLSGSYGGDTEKGLQTHVTVYADKDLTKQVAEYGWGYWEYTNSFTGDLKKGTYYACVKSRYANFGDFDGDIQIHAARYPIGKVLKASVKSAKDQKSATVMVKNLLGEESKEVCYVNGYVKKYQTASMAAWKDAKTISLKKGKGSFTVTKNDVYSIRMEDRYGNVYMTKVKVTGLKK